MSINDLLGSELVLPLLLVVGFVFFFSVPFLISKQEKELYGSSSAPNNVKTAVATIVDKRTEDNYLTHNLVVTYVVFQLEDGSRIPLAVRDAATMVVGDKGFLRYDGKRFISFQMDANQL